jgi:hypothetical protein
LRLYGATLLGYAKEVLIFSREGHCISGFFPTILKQKGGEGDEAFEC